MALPLAHNDWLERRAPIARHVDLDRADIGDDRLRADPVAGVLTVAACRVVGVVTEMFRPLRLERRLQHLLGEPSEETTRTDQRHPLSPRPVHELTCETFIEHRTSG
jgi:hypothetical protein